MDDRFEKINQRAEQLAKISGKEEIQQELGNLVGLLPFLSRKKEPQLVHNAEIVLSALESNPPNLRLARKVNSSLTFKRYGSIPFLGDVVSARSPSIYLILGLVGVMGVSLLVYAWLDLTVLEPFVKALGVEDPDLDLLFGIAYTGAVGSVVSILIRIRDVEKQKDVNPMLLFFTGFVKPIVGWNFAIFTYFAIEAGLIPLLADSKGNFYYLALAFVAGFSERFGRDIITRTEGEIPKGQKKQGKKGKD